MSYKSLMRQFENLLLPPTGSASSRVLPGGNLILFIWITVMLIVSLPDVQAYDKHADECVILLHGLGRTARSMGKIETALVEQHYQVWNGDYPSTERSIQILAQQTIEDGLASCRSNQAVRIHFVTHSMGGILVRQYLQKNQIPELANIVMLAPPNKGSEIADVLGDYYLYKKLMGPAGQQLGTGTSGLAAKLEPVPGVIGIIIGNSSSDPWFSPYIAGQDDGKVSVESARLDEMVDFLVVDAGHTFVMREYVVIQQILYFLEHDRFAESIKKPPGWFDF